MTNLVSSAGLAPVLAVAARAGLHELVAGHVRLGRQGGANAKLKIRPWSRAWSLARIASMTWTCCVMGDAPAVRRGACTVDVGDLPAHVQLRTCPAVGCGARLLANLARCAPLLPGTGQIAYVDVDDTMKQTYGYTKQGAGYGYTGVKGLNALIATVSTPVSAPVIATTRLRKGSAGSARGAARLVAGALVTAGHAELPGCGCCAPIPRSTAMT
jgi:hypothetical protein